MQFFLLSIIFTTFVLENKTNAGPVSQGVIPFIVSLRYNNEHYCGGSIISEYHILTAAHCVDSEDIIPQRIGVTSGSIIPNRMGVMHYVQQIYVHPLYRKKDSSLQNDIAVIVLNVKILFVHNYHKIIRLASRPPYPLAVGTAAGWGDTTIFANSGSDSLMAQNFLIMNGQQCNLVPNFPFNYNPSYDSRICARSLNSLMGSGQGDSGGPLVLGKELVGIVSHIKGRTGNGLPDIFTSVYFFRGFINEAIRMSGRPGVTAYTPLRYFF